MITKTIRVSALTVCAALMAGCAVPADPNDPITRNETDTAMSIIQGQSYRCAEVVKSARLHSDLGWKITCQAPDAAGVDRDQWSYVVMKNRKTGWAVTPYYPGSSL